MNRKTSKILSNFCFITGIIWIIAALRKVTIYHDMSGVVIYIIAAILSFILAFAYYKNLVK